MTAYIPIGLPACGKSTWAREHQVSNPTTVIVNNDTIRNAIYDGLGHRNWSGAIENQTRTQRAVQITDAAAAGVDVIVDNTHMNPATFAKTKELCEGLGYTVELMDFRHVSVAECIARDAVRTGTDQVGEAVIQKMYKQFGRIRDTTPMPRWHKDIMLPTAIIVDIDGTLAEMTDRGPYDEQLVYNDIPRDHVLRTVRAMQRQGVKVLIMSGRGERARVETHRWLQEKCGFQSGGSVHLEGYELWMRAADDRRRDSIVKRELYEAHVLGQYSVLAVFDDRASVIRECWSDLGLPVFRCGVIDHDNF